MIFSFGSNVVDIDIERTNTFYRSSRIITVECQCEGCRNFVDGAEKLDREILGFFWKLGIDILKPAEIIAWYSEDNGKSVHYGGWYHLCGRLISETDCWSAKNGSENEGSHSLDEERFFAVTDSFSVGFTNSVSLKDNDFPEPVIQMEILAHHYPWVLNTPNNY